MMDMDRRERKIFYDEGWNARVKGEEYDKSADYDWRCGWMDCNEAHEADRVLI